MKRLPEDIQVGTKVIYTANFDEIPQVDTVGRLTESRAYFVLACDMEKPASQQTKWRCGGQVDGVECYERVEPSGDAWRWNRKVPRVRLFSESVLAKLTEAYEAGCERRKEEKAEEERRDRARQELHREQMAETSTAMDGDLLSHILHVVTMPDGVRNYLIDCPVKRQYADRKNGWELILVTCRDQKRDRRNPATGAREEVDVIEVSVAGRHGGDSTFSSLSPAEYDSDMEALWDCVNSRYHSY